MSSVPQAASSSGTQAPSAQASAFVTISVANHSGVVINTIVKAIFEDTAIQLNQGNYGAASVKVFQLPAAATQISVDIKYEAFIDIWRGVYSNTFSDTVSWETSNMSFTVSGPDGSVRYSGPVWS
jgi:hypothetical protein